MYDLLKKVVIDHEKKERSRKFIEQSAGCYFQLVALFLLLKKKISNYKN